MTRRELLNRLDRIIAEIEQLIRDAEYWNGLPHNQQHAPIDVEADRVLLAEVRKRRRILMEGGQ